MRKQLSNDQWIEVGDGLLDMTMDDLERWIEAERTSNLRDVYPYLAAAIDAWSWPEEPSAANMGKRTLREFREIATTVSETTKSLAGN